MERNTDNTNNTKQHQSTNRQGSIKGEEPVAIVRVVAHRTEPGATIFIGAGSYMWWVPLYDNVVIAVVVW